MVNILEHVANGHFNSAVVQEMARHMGEIYKPSHDRRTDGIIRRLVKRGATLEWALQFLDRLAIEWIAYHLCLVDSINGDYEKNELIKEIALYEKREGPDIMVDV